MWHNYLIMWLNIFYEWWSKSCYNLTNAATLYRATRMLEQRVVGG